MNSGVGVYRSKSDFEGQSGLKEISLLLCFCGPDTWGTHLLKLDEGVAQRVPAFPVSDDLAAAGWEQMMFQDKPRIFRSSKTHSEDRLEPFDGPKARKDDLQVFVCGDGVEFAHEQNVFWRFHVCIGEVAHLRRTPAAERRHR